MSLVFLEFSVDQNIIQIYKNESVQKVSKNIIHNSLEDLGHWLAQKHYQISEMSKWCIDLSIISLSYANQIICVAEVDFGKYGGTMKMFESRVH